MVLMSSLPAGCSRHRDQQLWRRRCRLLRAWRVVPAGYYSVQGRLLTGAVVWNSLPAEVRRADSLHSFKRRLKSHFSQIAWMALNCHLLLLLLLLHLYANQFACIIVNDDVDDDDDESSWTAGNCSRPDRLSRHQKPIWWRNEYCLQSAYRHCIR